MNKYAECYAIYNTKNKTFLSSIGFWCENPLVATRYKSIDKAKKVKSRYDEIVKIMKISISVKGKIITEESE